MKQHYTPWKPRKQETLLVLAQADLFGQQYAAKGLCLTLRQLYYQFVAKDLLPESWVDPVYNRKKGLPLDTKNTVKNYKKLGSIVMKGRMGGFLDWDHFEDRLRNLWSMPSWETPSGILSDCANWYRVDWWEDQPFHIEIWVEKDALSGVCQRVARKWGVGVFACRGYVSSSEMRSAALRLIQKEEEGHTTLILHLGDHDPSGVDMTRDIQTRLDVFGSNVEVQRIALTMDQVYQYDPPPDPAKVTDSRYKKYSDEYGDLSWELDALEPQVLIDLIDLEIDPRVDKALFAARKELQAEGKEVLEAVAQRVADEEWDAEKGG